jgi:hypothetical protein
MNAYDNLRIFELPVAPCYNVKRIKQVMKLTKCKLSDKGLIASTGQMLVGAFLIGLRRST